MSPSRWMWFFIGWDACGLLWTIGTEHYVSAATCAACLVATLSMAVIYERAR